MSRAPLSPAAAESLARISRLWDELVALEVGAKGNSYKHLPPAHRQKMAEIRAESERYLRLTRDPSSGGVCS